MAITCQVLDVNESLIPGLAATRYALWVSFGVAEPSGVFGAVPRFVLSQLPTNLAEPERALPRSTGCVLPASTRAITRR